MLGLAVELKVQVSDIFLSMHTITGSFALVQVSVVDVILFDQSIAMTLSRIRLRHV